MGRKIENLPIETKITAALDTIPGWTATLTVPANEAWHIVGYEAIQNVQPLAYQAVFKILNVLINADLGAFNDMLLMSKGAQQFRSARGYAIGTIMEPIQISGGKTIVLSQISGETLGQLIGLNVFVYVYRIEQAQPPV